MGSPHLSSTGTPQTDVAVAAPGSAHSGGSAIVEGPPCPPGVDPEVWAALPLAEREAQVLPCPPGIDAEVWASLPQDMRQELAAARANALAKGRGKGVRNVQRNQTHPVGNQAPHRAG